MTELSFPSFNQDRGPRRFDVATGSSLSLPVNYCERQCLRFEDTNCFIAKHVVRNVDLSIVEFVGCNRIVVAQFSLKTRVFEDHVNEATYNNITSGLTNELTSLSHPC